MKLLVTLLLILGVTTYAQGLDCYACGDEQFDGEGDSSDACFTGLTTLNAGTCSGATGLEYCKTVFEIQDGVPRTVARSCGSTASAETAVPSNQCEIVFFTTTALNPTSKTTCEYTCIDDGCNSQTFDSLKVCSSDCGGDSNGHCDYLTGNCVCNSGWSGSDCTTEITTKRNCVQCSDETGSACTSATAATPCPGDEQYCSTTTSNVFDKSETILNTITVRGCTTAFRAVDECVFTDIYTDDGINDANLGYREFTCYSTCATDGCNTNTANGVVDTDEWAGLYCVQCSDTNADESCNEATTREVCPSGTTHCKSTVTYLISEVTDRPYVGDAPAYQLRSLVRECATAAVTASCTETSVSGFSEMKKVTCTETCTDDGCNIGWPARPDCIQCLTDNPPTNDYDSCIENPEKAKKCDFPYQKYCFITDTGIGSSSRESIQGYPRRITRDCSHVDYGNSCSSMTPRSTGVDSCNVTCTTDGCNVGSTIQSGSTIPFQTLAAVIIPTVLGWLAQARL